MVRDPAAPENEPKLKIESRELTAQGKSENKAIESKRTLRQRRLELVGDEQAGK